MGWNIACGTCGVKVYTTGTRLPKHKTPEGIWCVISHKAMEPVEYTIGYDDDWWVYSGGAWELGKDR